MSAENPNKVIFLEKVRQSNQACQAGDFATAVTLYSEAIELDEANHILYRYKTLSSEKFGMLKLKPYCIETFLTSSSNRSAALIKMGEFGKALRDALKARDFNPEWPKARKRSILKTLFFSSLDN